MSQTMPLEAAPASPADVDEAPWCKAHWGDLAVRSGEDALDGQDLGRAGSPGAGDAEMASAPVGAEGPW